MATDTVLSHEAMATYYILPPLPGLECGTTNTKTGNMNL